MLGEMKAVELHAQIGASSDDEDSFTFRNGEGMRCEFIAIIKDGAFTWNLTDDNLGRSWFNEQIGSLTLSGETLRPFKLPTPHYFAPGATVRLALHDLSAGANDVYFVLFGQRVLEGTAREAEILAQPHEFQGFQLDTLLLAAGTAAEDSYQLPTRMGLLTQVIGLESTGWIGIGLNDQGVMRDLFQSTRDAQGRINFDALAGVDQRPLRLETEHYFRPQAEVSASFLDLSAAENNARLVFCGERVTPGSPREAEILSEVPR